MSKPITTRWAAECAIRFMKALRGKLEAQVGDDEEVIRDTIEGEVDVDDQTIECPKHGSTFDLNTGRPVTLPATLPVDVFPVKTESDDILIEVPDD